MRKTLIALGIALLSAGAASAEERQARIEVSGLWCPSCSYIVGEALRCLHHKASFPKASFFVLLPRLL